LLFHLLLAIYIYIITDTDIDDDYELHYGCEQFTEGNQVAIIIHDEKNIANISLSDLNDSFIIVGDEHFECPRLLPLIKKEILLKKLYMGVKKFIVIRSKSKFSAVSGKS